MATPGILGLNALDARHQHLLALDSYKNFNSLPCGLPAELWSIILDHLYDNKRTLLSCLLACRAWGDFCRYHLYELFTWSTVNKFDEDGCSTFHPYPHYARRLAISGSLLDDDVAEDSNIEWLLPLAQHLDQFVSVTHLEVDSMDWDDIFRTHAWDKFTSAKGFLSQITCLDFCNIPLHPFQHILESICLFPSLEKLDYLPSHVDFGEEIFDLQSYTPSSSWHAFSTEHSPLQLPTLGFWTWFSAIEFTSLQTIRLDSVPTSDLPSLSSYLRLLGGVLKNFRIRFITPHDVYEFVESNVLANSTGLQRLELVGFIRQYPNDQFWAGEESFNLLTMLPGTSLSGLDVLLDGTPHRIADSVLSRLAAIDDILATSEKFSALNNVHLHLGRCDKVNQEISKAFPSCQKKGLITVSTSMQDLSLIAMTKVILDDGME
ncbi:hypothetical protein GGU10DRAFT_22846 [Lentinula aff. detonsa]|uniref:F-box domain-containing protein n=1 Tax=Lentinula aff. detonsa TaxID=2804958 RepID=A0AA38L532_9AGAR|nr:hypothetical protein GGU10DRAFT_22846 [Lentinula aff. detonsa]